MRIERLICLALGAAIVVRLLVEGMPVPLAVEPWSRLAHGGMFVLACALIFVGAGRR